MKKSPDAFRTISEVAESLDTPAHVLRFWESRFSQVKPVKRAGGRRYYRPADVALLGGIKHLLHDEGMTIRGVQKVLREQGIRHVAALAQDGADGGEVIEAKAEIAAPEAPVSLETPPAPVDNVVPMPTAPAPEPAPEPESEVEPEPAELPALETVASDPEPAAEAPAMEAEAPEQATLFAEPDLSDTTAPVEETTPAAEETPVEATPPTPRFDLDALPDESTGIVEDEDLPVPLATRLRALPGNPLPGSDVEELAQLSERLKALRHKVARQARRTGR